MGVERCLAEVGNAIGVAKCCPLCDNAGDSLFGSCRQPCYVCARQATNGRLKVIEASPELWMND